MRTLLLLIFAILAFVFASVAMAGEITYTKHIKPIFDSKCIGCHGPDSPEHKDFKHDHNISKEDLSKIKVKY